MAFSELYLKAISGQSLSQKESYEVFSSIIRGEVSDIRLAALLSALHLKGETQEELLGAVEAVRYAMLPIKDLTTHAIDVCGTGGDGLGTLNVSTSVSFILAGLGVVVAKHGGRALSSKSGATDVLEALGIPAESDFTKQETILKETRLAFLAAPLHHPAMKYAASVRKELGFRTIFNLLGPLSNPAQVQAQLIGVFDKKWCRVFAEVLASLGSKHLCVVHGETDKGGIDEVTLAGESTICFFQDGHFIEDVITPDFVDLPHYSIDSLKGGDALENAEHLCSLLKGSQGCYRDTVLLNAAIALHVAGRGNILVNGKICASALKNNIALAAHSLESGLAYEALMRAQKAYMPHALQSLSSIKGRDLERL